MLSTPSPRCLSWEHEVVVGLWRDNPGAALVDIPWAAARPLVEKLAAFGGSRIQIGAELGRLRDREPIIIHLRDRWRLALLRAERRDVDAGSRLFVLCPDASLRKAVVFDGVETARNHARLTTSSAWAWFHADRYEHEQWLDDDGIAWDSRLHHLLAGPRRNQAFRITDRRGAGIRHRRP